MKNMGREKSNERIVVEEILKNNRKANVIQICKVYFGYDPRKVSEILGNMKRC